MMEHIPLRAVLAVAFVLVSAATRSSAGPTKKELIESGGRTRVCYVFAPGQLSADSAAPVLLLFHGSGRDGLSQINEWKSLADREGLLLAAPNALDPRQWVIPGDGPELLRDVVAFLGGRYNIDLRRIYAFGHSAGAAFALRMAPLESNFLAAIAVHAGAFRSPAEAGILPFAERKIPVLIVVGTMDPYFPVEAVRQTQAAFSAAGLPAEVREIPDHDHNYYAESKKINAMVWEFLSPRHLDADAHYSDYRIESTAAGVSILPAGKPGINEHPH